MRVIFKTVRFKNFCATGNAFTEINLSENQLNLIVGKNGAGKSQFIEAIVFALYNQAFRDANKGELLNTINSKECVVELELDVNKVPYKIIRGIKPDIFEVYCRGELLPYTVKDDMQKNLEKNIIKMNYKTFIQIVVLGTASFMPFMKLPAAARREIVEALLDLSIFSVMNVILKKKMKDLTDGITNCNFDISKLEQKTSLLQSQLKSLEQDNTNKIAEIEAIIVKIEDEYAALNIQYAEAIEDLAAIAVPDTSKIELKNNKLRELLGTIGANIKQAKDNKTFFEKNDICVVCSQPIGIDHKHEMITKFDAVVQKQSTGKKDLEETIKATQTEIEEGKEQKLKAIAAKNRVDQLTTRMQSLVKMKDQQNKIIESLTTKTGSIDDTEKDLLLSRHDLEQKKIELADLMSKQAHYNVILTMFKDDGIKSKIINKYIPMINAQVNSYLSTMDFFCNFTLDENFKETFKIRYRDKMSYGALSQGQKARIDLALILTWRDIAKIKNSISTNLLIMDEVFDGSLDSDGIEDLMKIFRTMHGQNLWVISHKELYIDKFENVHKFEMLKNFSVMSKM